MKNNQAKLFYLLGLIAISLIPIVYFSLKGIFNHDNSFPDLYYKYLSVTSVLSFLTGLVYSIMQKKGRPISSRTGNIHFFLIIIGLIFSRNIYLLIMGFFIFGFLPSSFASDTISFVGILIGPIFIIAGLVTFIIGIRRAVKNNANAY